MLGHLAAVAVTSLPNADGMAQTVPQGFAQHEAFVTGEMSLALNSEDKFH